MLVNDFKSPEYMLSHLAFHVGIGQVLRQAINY